MKQGLWLCGLLVWSSLSWATDHLGHGNAYLQKRVFFSQDKQTLIAVDSRRSRNIEFRLRVREQVIAVREGQVSIAVATDQRLFGFSVRAGGWKPVRLELREQLIRLQVSDFSIFAETTQRILTFNGLTGKWFVRRKSTR